MSVGKNFIADPNVWEVVNGTLYMNLDNDTKTIWVKSISGNIKKADNKLPAIKGVAAAKL